MSENKNKTVLDPEMLSEALKAQTKDTIESLLEGAVKSYIKEAAKDEDLEDDDADKVEPANNEVDEPTVDEVPAEGAAQAPAAEPQVSGSTDEPMANGEEWSEFDNYKVGDGEYDMTGESDPMKVKAIFSRMDGGDELVIKQQDDEKIEFKDNETGKEYLITFDSGEESDGEEAVEGEEPVFEITLNNKPSMNEEYGYTDNYQDKDAMEGKEPYDAATPNETRIWDGGAPDRQGKGGKEKPWAGPSKTKGKPYSGELKEEDEMEDGNLFEISFDECGPKGCEPVDGPMEEGLGMADEHSMRLQKDGRENPRHNNAYGNTTSGSMSESIQRKLNKIEEENKVLKSSLVKFRKALNEAVLTNYNIGNVVKLVFENATSKQEKYDILKRFSNEAKTVDQSNALYESINKQLKGVNKGGLSIDKPMSINESAVKNINESTIYKNDDEAINYALDMIQRMNNL